MVKVNICPGQGGPVRECPGRGVRVKPAAAAAREVAAPREERHGHARGARGEDAGRAVLDHEAAGGLRAHLGRGVEEEVGGGLAAGDLRGGEEAPHQGHEPRGPEARARPLRRGGGGDAEGDRAGPQHLGRAGGGAELGGEAAQEAGAVLPLEARGEGAAPALADGPRHGGEAAAEEVGGDVGLVEDDARLGREPDQDLGRDGLAVDEHAVAVEDDEVGGGRAAHPASLPSPRAQDGAGRRGAQGGACFT